MNILSLSYAKAYLRMEETDTAEDTVITGLCEAAESAVLDYIEYTIEEAYNEFSEGQWNALKMAACMVLEDLYNNRGTKDQGGYQLNGTVLMFLKPLSKLA